MFDGAERESYIYLAPRLPHEMAADEQRTDFLAAGDAAGSGAVPAAQRITSKYMTKYERARVQAIESCWTEKS